jgi:endonuclease/exonuclease/phosphatase family metal-dependent hydrolase
MPARISIITCNIWLTRRWARRAPALKRFLRIFDPDILALQELQPRSRRAVDATLPRHERVRDGFRGWAGESNLWWRASMFAELDHGAEDVGIPNGDRRLFWVRLRRTGHGGSLLVATAHLTQQRNDRESRTGHSPRVRQITRIIAALRRLARPSEPLFFMGDMNDAIHPTHKLAEAGYTSCFAALGLQPPPTFKCYPTADVEPGRPPISQCVDWLYANAHARAVAAAVPQFYYRDSAPSDHWPVQAVYELD